MTELCHGVCLRIAYDGTGFHGWQAQEGLRTVQGQVEEAIVAMGLKHGRVRGCSRTDAGVHADDQVIAFSSDKLIEPRGWVLGLNDHLPAEIRVRDGRTCHPRFDPRFHTERKHYRYLVQCGFTPDPRFRNHAWHLGHRDTKRTIEVDGDASQFVDLKAMQVAAEQLVGTHDFVAFRASGDERATTTRTMRQVSVTTPWQGRPDLLAIDVVGDAFLKHMVRIMAGTLVDIGTGHLAVDAMATLLSPVADRTMAGQTAPACGLTLVKVTLGRFDGPLDDFGRPTQAPPWCVSGRS